MKKVKSNPSLPSRDISDRFKVDPIPGFKPALRPFSTKNSLSTAKTGNYKPSIDPLGVSPASRN